MSLPATQAWPQVVAGVVRLTLAACSGLCLAGALAGCASLFGSTPEKADVPAAGPAAPAPQSYEIRVDAPGELATLLERYLDLTRLPAASASEAVSDSEWVRLIEAAPAQVRELLQTEGYFAPTVAVQRGPQVRAGQPRLLTLVVDPGTQARVSRVTLVFEGALQEQAGSGDARAVALSNELRRSWALPANARFRNTLWSDAKAATLARLRASGYAAALWNGTAAEVDAEGAAVRLFLVADSGPLFRAGPIEVEGLVVHEASTVRHLAAFATGTPLTESLLLDYQERLQKSNLFESVSVTHDTDPARAGAATVRVNLREQPLQAYTLGVGFSSNNGPRATAEQINRRLFGRPYRSRTAIELARLKRTLDLELSTHPFEGLQRNVVGVAFERLETSSDVVLSQRVRLGRAWDAQAYSGALAGLRAPAEGGSGGRTTLTLERLAFVEAERGQRTTTSSKRVSNALSLNHHLVLRSLDSVVLPTEGWTLALQGGGGRSSGNLDQSGFFGRGYARLTAYLPLGANWYAQGRAEVGQVFRRDGVGAPDSQLFRAGGDDSVRGYGYRELGPVVDGSVTSGGALATASIELARPFFAHLPSVWGAVFVDAGNASTSFKNFSAVSGAGFGVRWRSPVGPLKLDLARAIDTGRWRLHFGIGIAL